VGEQGLSPLFHGETKLTGLNQEAADVRERLEALAGDKRRALQWRNGVKIEISVALEQKTEDADTERFSQPGSCR
jgi:hypothetical protein